MLTSEVEQTRNVEKYSNRIMKNEYRGRLEGTSLLFHQVCLEVFE